MIRIAVRVGLGMMLLVAGSSACRGGSPEAGAGEASTVESPTGSEASAAAPDRAEILAAVESYYDAFSDRDWTRFAASFWPDATITTVWQPPGEPAPVVHVNTVGAFIEQAPEGPGSREIFEERMVGSRVLQHGGLAHVWARYEARFGDPGDIMEWEGVDAITLMRHDGEWRIVSIAFAPDA